MFIETHPQSRRQKPYARLFQFTGLFFLIGVMLACSFSASIPSSAPTQPVATQPAPTQPPASTQSPSFNVITIPLGVDPKGPYQTPPYFLETDGGHYLLFTMDSRKLIYDGKEVYSGDLAGLGRDSMALSQNGLHYAYVLLAAEGGNFHYLFINRGKINSADLLPKPAGTDDGQYYFSTRCVSASG